ncbi:MAG: rod shape-determining protein RodA [Gammaproteobacteria bacterium]|nr:rod shape-determining protein RodA [Gammaproteobacteria bacterium]
MFPELSASRTQRTVTATQRVLRALHLDGPLIAGLGVLACMGLFVLYSAAGENIGLWTSQAVRLGIATAAMVALAQVPPHFLRMLAPAAYTVGVLLLIAVAVVGEVSMGAQRWLDLGFLRFQPSEIMKIALPMMVAWYLHERPLPPSVPHTLGAMLLVLVPVLLIAEQPDLGTAILVGAAGTFVLLLGGLRKRFIVGGIALLAAVAPVAWHFMHEYQRQRVMTLLDPQSDPLGAGYHIIQSQIAIGSGGVFGKGWMNGSQAHLEFLPERSTDFIFAVIGEELGLLGQAALLLTYLAVIGRAMYLSVQCRDTFSRLVSGSTALTFSVYVFVNTGMVSGILPVVGVPLPLVSYGGTSMVTLLAGFGILMSLYSHRKLVGS